MRRSGLPARAAVLSDYQVEEQIGFLLRKANQRHTAIFAEGMAESELTPTQFTALIKVVELGQVTQNHLGRLAAMDPATIQGVVRRLIDRGLINRTDDPQDRRTIVLAPTEAGLALAAKAAQAGQRITEATLAPLGPEERAQLVAILRKIS